MINNFLKFQNSSVLVVSEVKSTADDEMQFWSAFEAIINVFITIFAFLLTRDIVRN